MGEPYPIPARSLKQRTVSWHDRRGAGELLSGLSGLEVMRGIRDGTLPEPPMARLIGFHCVAADPGEVAMKLHHDPSLENAVGMLHGGAAFAMLDTAMGAAAQTMAPAGSRVVTMDLTVNYLRPVTKADAPVIATARVARVGRRSAFVTGEVHDATRRLVVHAVGNFSILATPTRT